MSWSSPMTAVANSVFTAAQFNTFVRDNLNETAPAKATAPGRLIVTAGLNSVVERPIVSQLVATGQTTTGTGYGDLATVGPTVTVTTGTSAIVMWSAQMSNDTAGGLCIASYGVTGASSVIGDDGAAVMFTSAVSTHIGRYGAADFVGLTAGSNTFTMKYRVSTGTGTFSRRTLIVIPL